MSKKERGKGNPDPGPTDEITANSSILQKKEQEVEQKERRWHASCSGKRHGSPTPAAPSGRVTPHPDPLPGGEGDKAERPSASRGGEEDKEEWPRPTPARFPLSPRERVGVREIRQDAPLPAEAERKIKEEWSRPTSPDTARFPLSPWERVGVRAALPKGFASTERACDFLDFLRVSQFWQWTTRPRYIYNRGRFTGGKAAPGGRTI